MSATGARLLFGLDKLEMLFHGQTAGFTSAQWAARDWPGLHSAHWLLAHLALSVSQAAGQDPVFSTELDAQFDFGAPSVEDTAGWPSPDELLSSWEKGRRELAALWSARTEADWATAVRPNRLGMRDLADEAQFTLEHAVYHVGQLGAIRRMLGLKGMV